MQRFGDVKIQIICEVQKSDHFTAIYKNWKGLLHRPYGRCVTGGRKGYTSIRVPGKQIQADQSS